MSCTKEEGKEDEVVPTKMPTLAAPTDIQPSLEIPYTIFGRSYPVGRPIVASGVVVSYIKAGPYLELIGWDATTGDYLWDMLSAPGTRLSNGSAIQASLVEIAGRIWVPYLTLGPGGQDVVRAVDVTNGEASPAGEEFRATCRPFECDSGGICIRGVLNDGYTGRLRLDPLTGALTKDQSASIPQGTYSLGGGLYEDEGNLGFAIDGQTQWQRSWQDVFGGHSDSDWGLYSFVKDDSDVVVVGAYARTEERNQDELVSITRHLNEDRVVGLKKTTGATVWQYDGAVIEETYSTHNEIVIHLVGSGTITYTKVADQWVPVISDLGEAWMARIGISDGIPKWGRPIKAVAWWADQPQFAETAEYRFVESRAEWGPPDHWVLLDLELGSGQVLHSKGVYPCQTVRDRVELLHHPMATSMTKYPAGYDYWACASNGTTPVANWSVEAVDLIGSHDPSDQSLVVVGGKTSILVFRLP
jgi:hypothetical protein